MTEGAGKRVTPPTPEALATYRREYRWLASTIASAGVVVATLAGGYLVAASLNREGVGGSPASGGTNRQLARSLARVIDARLAEGRLKVLLGIAEAPAQADAAKEVNALERIGQQQGLLAPRVAAGDFAAGVIHDQASKLSSMLAASPEVDTFLTNLRAAAETIEKAPTSERPGLVASILQKAVGDDWRRIADAWIATLEHDAAVSTAWGRLPEPRPEIRPFIEQALALDTLPATVADQFVSDATLLTMPQSELDLAGRDLAARLAWGTAAVLFIGLWMAVIFICAWQIWTLTPMPLGTLAGGGIAALLLGVVAWRTEAIAPGSLELLGPLLIELEEQVGTNVVATSRLLIGLAAAAIVMMLCASAAITQIDDQMLLKSQAEGLRAIFNAGAALLVAGVLEIATLYGWAASAFEPATGAPGVLGNVALIAAGFSGALFSAALVLVYLPAASTLRRRASADTTAVADEGFGDSTFQQLGRLLQALAPLLAALPLSGLIALVE
jgi:hypothetical protein